MIWLVRARLGKKEEATKEFGRFIASRKKGQDSDWLQQIYQFFRGNISDAEFFRVSTSSDDEIKKSMQAEAYFLAANVRLIAGDKTTAKDYFTKALLVESPDFPDDHVAIAELQLILQDPNFKSSPSH